MGAPVNVSVLYPNKPDATFDLDYYLKTHMPLVQEHWGKQGLKSWTVTKFAPSPDGKEPEYSVGAYLVWESEEALKTAFGGPSTQTIFADIPKFTNTQPVLVGGGQVGASS